MLQLLPPLPFSTARLINLSSSALLKSKNISRSVRMGQEILPSLTRRQADFRLCNVAGYTTDLLEIHAEDPSLHVLFIPGNPGIVSFYKDFLESLYEMLGGRASITAIGHISHTKKDWENGRLFTLQEQIDHKIEFMRELQKKEIPILLVAHSVGSYMSVEVLRRFHDQVVYFIGLHPFLMLKRRTRRQVLIGKLVASPMLSAFASSIVALLGTLPGWASSFLIRKTIGKSWTNTAVDAARSHLLKYHTMRNMLFLTITEFETLSKTPDWGLLKKLSEKISFLFCDDDQWAPLQLYDEISKQVPEIDLYFETEGHTHEFCCTEAGSLFAAKYVASLIKKHI